MNIARPAVLRMTVMAMLIHSPAIVAQQKEATATPAEWLADLRNTGGTKLRPGSLFMGGCPESTPWKAAALTALTQATLTWPQERHLATALAFGVTRCPDSGALEWLLARLTDGAREGSEERVWYLTSQLGDIGLTPRTEQFMWLLATNDSLKAGVRSTVAFALQRQAHSDEERLAMLMRFVSSGRTPPQYGEGVTGVLMSRPIRRNLLTELAAAIDRDPRTVVQLDVVGSAVVNITPAVAREMPQVVASFSRALERAEQRADLDSNVRAKIGQWRSGLQEIR